MLRRTLLLSPLALAAQQAAAQQAKELRITGLKTELKINPPREPNYDAIHKLGVDAGSVTLRIETNAGITGYATSTFGMVKGGPKVVQTILEEELRPLLIGEDPAFPKRIRAKLWRELEYHGVGGIIHFAVAAADIAIWDILGKHAGMPVWKMLGAYRDRMPCYSMCGWYYDNDSDLSKYKRSIEQALAHGYKAIKMKTGRYGMADDERRIQIALDLCPRVMIDANQVFNRNEALRRGRLYQQMGAFWYEEPLPPHDMEGYTELARELDIRIATGENLYTKYAFADLIARKGADVVQPDNRRAGGVTEWLEIAALADAAGLELASHGGGSANMNMLLTMPNAIYMETGGAQKNMVNGEILAPQAPGMSTEPA